MSKAKRLDVPFFTRNSSISLDYCCAGLGISEIGGFDDAMDEFDMEGWYDDNGERFDTKKKALAEGFYWVSNGQPEHRRNNWDALPDGPLLATTIKSQKTAIAALQKAKFTKLHSFNSPLSENIVTVWLRK